MSGLTWHYNALHWTLYGVSSKSVRNSPALATSSTEYPLSSANFLDTQFAYLMFHITVLYCTALYCTALYCTALYCTALYCTAVPTTVSAAGLIIYFHLVSHQIYLHTENIISDVLFHIRYTTHIRYTGLCRLITSDIQDTANISHLIYQTLDIYHMRQLWMYDIYSFQKCFCLSWLMGHWPWVMIHSTYPITPDLPLQKLAGGRGPGTTCPAPPSRWCSPPPGWRRWWRGCPCWSRWSPRSSTDLKENTMALNIFTESAPRPIQSLSRDVCLLFVCLSPPSATGTGWTGDFWSKSVLLKLHV